MASWIIFVAETDKGNWNIAQQQALWDMTAHFKVQRGDLLYFFLNGAHKFLGQALATSDATPLQPDSPTPWKDKTPRAYKWRFTFDLLSASPRSQPDDWKSLVARLDKKGAPQAPREYTSSHDEELLATFFDPTSSSIDSDAWDADEERRRILAKEGVEARRVTYGAIRTRQGQGKFREKLIRAYEGQCAVTGSRALSVLEAAHIREYGGENTNRQINGLLLRADIHTLFDLDRLAIAACDEGGQMHYKTFIAPELRTTEYGQYHGAPLAMVPKSPREKPDAVLLALHNSRCSWLKL